MEDEVLSPGFKFKESKLLVFFSFLPYFITLWHFDLEYFDFFFLEDYLDQLFYFLDEEIKAWKLSDLSK